MNVTSAAHGTTINLPRAGTIELVAGLRAIAAECTDGSVQVMESSGRKTRPDQMEIVNLDQPAKSTYGKVFLSARATLNTVVYGFHAYLHPRATIDSPSLYFSVTGPSRETCEHGEFQITEEFRWTGERPLNPLIVKFALRQWAARAEVRAAFHKARRDLPKAEKWVPPGE